MKSMLGKADPKARKTLIKELSLLNGLRFKKSGSIFAPKFSTSQSNLSPQELVEGELKKISGVFKKLAVSRFRVKHGKFQCLDDKDKILQSIDLNGMTVYVSFRNNLTLSVQDIEVKADLKAKGIEPEDFFKKKQKIPRLDYDVYFETRDQINRWASAMESHGAVISRPKKAGVLFKMQQNDDKASHTIYLRFGVILTAVDNQPTTFTIAENGDEDTRVYHFRAETPYSRDSWLSSLKQASSMFPYRCFSNSLHEGYMDKPSPQFKHWRRRYFVLFEDKLVYYRRRMDAMLEADSLAGPIGEKGKPSAGTVAIVGGSEAENVHKDDEHYRPFTFTVAENGDEFTRRYYCACSSKRIRDQWTGAILTVLMKKEHRVNKGSLYEGYLWHSDKHMKSWSKRYVILLDEHLLCFKKRADKKEHQFLNLKGGSVVEELESQDSGSSESKAGFTFCVSDHLDESGGTTYYFATSSAKSCKHWVKKLSKLLSTKNHKVHADSIKEGYMFKTGPHFKAWSSRYFVLRKDSLKYYRKRLDIKEAGTILLPGSAEVEKCDGDPRTPPTIPYMFWLARNGDSETRKYFASVKQRSLRREWIRAIAEVIRTKDSRINKNSIKEGYMWKCSSNNKKWTKRYCILTNDSLTYYRQREAKEKAGAVLIGGEAEIMIIDSWHKFWSPKRKWSFTVAQNGDETERAFRFVCKSNKERAAWVNALHELASSKIARVNPMSIREGYLQVAQSSNLKNWKKMYFILLEHVLLYYKSRNDETHAGRIELTGDTRICDRSSIIDSEKANVSFGSMRSKDSIDISVTFDEAGPPSRNSKSSAAAFIPKSGHFKRAKVDTDLLGQGVQPAMATAEDRKSGESGGFRFQIEPPWHEKERAPLVLEASHEAQANNWITDIMNQLLLQPLTAKDGAVKEGEVYTTNSSEKKKKKQYAKSQVALFPSKLCMWKIGCGLTDMDEEEKDNYYWDVNLSAAVTIKVLNCNPLTPNMFPLQLSAGVIVTKNGVDEYSWVTETLCFPSLVLRGSWLESISYVIQKHKSKDEASLAQMPPVSYWPGKLADSVKTSCYVSLPRVVVEVFKFFEAAVHKFLLQEDNAGLKRASPTQMTKDEAEAADEPAQPTPTLQKRDSKIPPPLPSSPPKAAKPQTLLHKEDKSDDEDDNKGDDDEDADADAGARDVEETRSTNRLDFFRSPGNQRLVLSWINDYHLDVPVILEDIHSCAALLRVFLARLHCPIISAMHVKAMLDDFKKAVQAEDIIVSHQSVPEAKYIPFVQQCIDSITGPEHTLLHFLLHFLRTLLNTVELGLSLLDLAREFASLVFRTKPEDPVTRDLLSVQHKQYLFMCLIYNFEALFPGVPPQPLKRLSETELPTYRKRYKDLTVIDLLQDEYGVSRYSLFAKEQLIDENIKFILPCNEYKAQPTLERALQLCSESIKAGSKGQINISAEMRKAILDEFEGSALDAIKSGKRKLTGNEFNLAYDETVLLITTNDFPRFKNSDFFDEWVTKLARTAMAEEDEEEKEDEEDNIFLKMRAFNEQGEENDCYINAKTFITSWDEPSKGEIWEHVEVPEETDRQSKEAYENENAEKVFMFRNIRKNTVSWDCPAAIRDVFRMVEEASAAEE